MQTVSELDDQHANVLRHRDDHFPHGFRLGALPVLHFVELRHTVNEHSDFITEIRFELVEGVLSVLDRVVKERCGYGDGSNSQIGQNLSHREWVRDVGLTTLSCLSDVSTLGNPVRALKKVHIRFRVVLANCLEERVEGVIGRCLRKKSREKCAQARG